MKMTNWMSYYPTKIWSRQTLSLSLALVIMIFSCWTIYYLIFDHVPDIQIPINATLAITFSRWWDVLIGPLMVIHLAHFRQLNVRGIKAWLVLSLACLAGGICLHVFFPSWQSPGIIGCVIAGNELISVFAIFTSSAEDSAGKRQYRERTGFVLFSILFFVSLAFSPVALIGLLIWVPVAIAIYAFVYIIKGVFFLCLWVSRLCSVFWLDNS